MFFWALLITPYTTILSKENGFRYDDPKTTEFGYKKLDHRPGKILGSSMLYQVF